MNRSRFSWRPWLTGRKLSSRLSEEYALSNREQFACCSPSTSSKWFFIELPLSATVARMPRVARSNDEDGPGSARAIPLRSPGSGPGGRIVLAAAASKTNQQIASELQMPEVTVSKWRRGFVREGLEGLQHALVRVARSNMVRKSYNGCSAEPAN